jgi:hypothetical protein
VLESLDRLARVSPEAVRKAAGALRKAHDTDGPAERSDGLSGNGNGEQTAETVGSPAVLDKGREWWKLSLYWAAETLLFTLSPLLKPSEDTNDLSHVPRYRYVGTARFGEFPGHVLERATALTRDGLTDPPTPPLEPA